MLTAFCKFKVFFEILIAILAVSLRTCTIDMPRERQRDARDFEQHRECKGRKALRVIPRGKLRLTVYRAHQVACRDGGSSPLEEQYFKEQTAGKSWRKC